MQRRFDLPDLGVGVGLRSVHYADLLRERQKVDWLEVLSENYLATGGRPLAKLEAIAELYPLALHGVSLNIGSSDPLDRQYLTQLKSLARHVQAHWLGDHVCWTGVRGRNSHDLLPLPLTEQALAHTAARVRQVQDFLERPLVLENPSTYLAFEQDQMPEWEFLARLAQESDCALLLDVNNVYVSSRNHGFDPREYLKHVPWERVVQLHLAGHSDHGTHCIDTHDGHVADAVWELYGDAVRLGGSIATLIEWDAKIPDFEVLRAEAQRAKRLRAKALRQRAAALAGAPRRGQVARR